jgi:hypothetical protein
VTVSLLVHGLVKRLKSAGYTRLSTPFKVASVDFEFTGALRGRDGRALDLVLIIDTATGDHGDRDGARVRQRVEALSRALDITRSRYLLTVILAGASLPDDIDALSETCRVLNVEAASLDGEGRPVDAAAAEAFDDHIRVLLPLNLPHTDDEPGAPLGDTISELLAVLPKDLDEPLVRGLVEASSQGEAAVTTALGDRLAEVLTLEAEDD